MQKSNFFRTAILTSQNEKSVLDNLRTSLPDGYKLEQKQIFDGRVRTLIKTPSDDEIILTTEGHVQEKPEALEQKKTLLTDNVVNQDGKPMEQQPDLENDELTKFANAMKQINSEVHVEVKLSEFDLNQS